MADTYDKYLAAPDPLDEDCDHHWLITCECADCGAPVQQEVEKP